MDQDYSIFPERRPVYGGFWIRFGAWFLDTLILIPVSMLITYLITGSLFFDPGRYGGGFSYILTGDYALVQTSTFVCSWLYYALQESGPAQATLGKRALSLKVTSLHGQRVSFGIATGRYFSKILSTITLLIGYMMAGWDSKKQALHDKIAGTVVISTEGSERH